MYWRSNLRRQNSRNKFTTSVTTSTTTTALPQVAEGEESNVSEQEVSEPTSTTAKAVGYVVIYCVSNAIESIFIIIEADWDQILDH